MIRLIFKFIAVLVLTGTVVTCGDQLPESRISKNASIVVNGFALIDDQNGDATEAGPLTQKVQEVGQLQLEIAGCQSGYRLVTSSVQKLQLYKHDRDCRVILHRFQFNGETYRPVGLPLTGPVGTSVMFHSQKNEIPVVISSMISNPLKDNDEVAYSIAAKIRPGSHKNILGLKNGPSGRIRRGSGSLRKAYFTVARSSIIAMIPETKSFGMRFELECVSDMKHEALPELRRCKRTNLKDISYLLVEDRYQNHPTLEQMESLFKVAGIDVDPRKDYQPANHFYHGGFSTSSGPVILRTPNNTAVHPHMLLILKSPRSFQYFNLEIQTGL